GTSRLLSWTPTITQEGDYTVNVTVTDNGVPALSNARSIGLRVVARLAKTSGPEGGVIQSLLNAGGALYAGTYGGVYRSIDGGQSWTAVNNGFSGIGLDVRALLSVGTNLYAGSLGGVYRSIDGGQSWTAINNGLSEEGLFVNALLSAGANLYAGTDR